MLVCGAVRICSYRTRLFSLRVQHENFLLYFHRYKRYEPQPCSVNILEGSPDLFLPLSVAHISMQQQPGPPTTTGRSTTSTGSEADNACMPTYTDALQPIVQPSRQGTPPTERTVTYAHQPAAMTASRRRHKFRR